MEAGVANTLTHLPHLTNGDGAAWKPVLQTQDPFSHLAFCPHFTNLQRFKSEMESILTKMLEI